MDMYDLELIEPSEAMEKQAMDYRREYIDSGEPHIHGSGSFSRYEKYAEWLEHIKYMPKDEELSSLVPATTYFSVRKSDGKIIGTIQLRHRLTESLEKSGGHIGYGIRPSERKKGYGSQQLALVIEKAREMKIPRVMISCDKSNHASAMTAVKNGGVLTWEGYCEQDESDIQIYWIDTSLVIEGLVKER